MTDTSPTTIYTDGDYSVEADLTSGDAAIRIGTQRNRCCLGPLTALPPVVLRQMADNGVSDATHYWACGALLRRAAGPAWIAAAEQYTAGLDVRIAAKASAIEAAIPGLGALRAAYEDEECYHEEFERMMEDEDNDGVNPPKRPTVNAAEIAKQYPRAACYLKAEAYEHAAHDLKSAAGTKARHLLEGGGSIEDAQVILANWLPPDRMWD